MSVQRDAESALEESDAMREFNNGGGTIGAAGSIALRLLPVALANKHEKFPNRRVEAHDGVWARNQHRSRHLGCRDRQNFSYDRPPLDRLLSYRCLHTHALQRRRNLLLESTVSRQWT